MLYICIWVIAKGMLVQGKLVGVVCGVGTGVWALAPKTNMKNSMLG